MEFEEKRKRQNIAGGTTWTLNGM